MADYFRYNFPDKLPRQRQPKRYREFPLDEPELPLVVDIQAQCKEYLEMSKAFSALPEANRRMILRMSTYMINSFNVKVRGGSPGGNSNRFWGLYVIGSRSRSEVETDSDLDLLSVGSVGCRAQGFGGNSFPYDMRGSVFEGFDLELPEKLPNRYNVGDVDRKYLCRAVPRNVTGAEASVDLNVVDLAHDTVSLEEFKIQRDVDEAGQRLSRLPLIELTSTYDTNSWQS